jgi:hypothetical protein
MGAQAGSNLLSERVAVYRTDQASRVSMTSSSDLAGATLRAEGDFNI